MKVIEGLRIEVKGSEIRERIDALAKEARARAQRELREMEVANRVREQVLDEVGPGPDDEIEDEPRRRRRNPRRRFVGCYDERLAEALAYFAAHVDPEAVYLLNHDEVAELFDYRVSFSE